MTNMFDWMIREFKRLSNVQQQSRGSPGTVIVPNSHLYVLVVPIYSYSPGFGYQILIDCHLRSTLFAIP